MIAMFWNCQGLGHASIVCALRELCSSHRLVLVFLSEVRISNDTKIKNIAASLKFDSFFLVPSCGSATGLCLLWNNSIDIQIVFLCKYYLLSCYEYS